MLYLNSIDKINKGTREDLELCKEISFLEDHVRRGDERVAPGDGV